MNPPSQTREDDGTVVFTWDDTVIIKADILHIDRRGKYRVSAAYQGAVLNVADVDLLNLKDREDFYKHCGTLDGKVDNWLERLVWISEHLPRQATEETWELQATTLSAIRPKRVEFYWKPFLPKGRPTVIDGDPGVGKSALLAKIIAHMTTGRAFPTMLDGTYEQDFLPQHVCLLAAEDDPADTIRPRIEINGGNVDYVHLLEGRRNAKGEHLPLTMQDVSMLVEALERFRPALLIFDPIQSYFGPGVNMNHMSDTRPVLDAVAAICRPFQCTPMYVRHIGKALHARALHAGIASIDIVAHMRAALMLGRDPEDPERRILAVSKANLAPATPSMAFRLVSATTAYFVGESAEELIVEAARVDWDGRSPLQADDIAVPSLRDETEKPALEQARDFLQELLQDGPVLADEVAKAAKQAGLSLATVRRAKELEQIRARRRPLDDIPRIKWPWEWLLPTEEGGRYPGKEEEVPF
jgi:AAA domain